MPPRIQDRIEAPQDRTGLPDPGERREVERSERWAAPVVLVLGLVAIVAGLVLGQLLLILGGALLAASTWRLVERGRTRRGAGPLPPR